MVSEEEELEGSMDHLQARVNLEHVGHPVEALARHGSMGLKEVEEEKRTSNFRTVEGEIALRLQPRGTTMCDSQRGRGHHNGGEDAFPEQWASDPPRATRPMPKHFRS